jgi:hypothetical protein
VFAGDGWRGQSAAVAIVVLVTVLHFLLWAPVFCGAGTRDGTPCRNNAAGY